MQIDNPCEVSNEPGEPCPNEAEYIVEEPWTPDCFKLLVCASHRQDKLELGYHDRGRIYPEES